MGKGVRGIVFGKGKNDMHWGWKSESEYNKRIYQLWHSMIQRCYDEKYHEKYPTYKNCYCCERWLTLSNFIKDITKIPNYEMWLSGFSEKINPYQLDKDIKSGGTNKCYCLEECQFVSYAENIRQALKTRDNAKISEARKGKTGEKNGMFGKHHSEETRAKISKAMKGKYKGEKSPNHGELVAQIDKNTDKILNLKYNREYIELGFNHSTISSCCRGKYKTHKGYIWKYISNCTPEQLNEYYESH